ncbi:MAG: hypothetical protein PCFJNLEI_02351 [Verrucomicrobiae bacterium]|nr:hypothetical protein [Verrucomicrobiae bacterium]
MKSNYDKYPFVPVAGECWTGWDAIGAQLPRDGVVVVECYTGVDERAIAAALPGRKTIFASEALLPAAEIDRLCAPYLGGSDPLFGFLCPLELRQFFDPAKLAALRQIAAAGKALVIGQGAALIHPGDVLVYADLARWEAQLRHRRAGNAGEKYKRAFFVDWRVADRWKRAVMARWDFVLDTNQPATPKLVTGAAVRRGLAECTRRPFRIVPFFDPGPWGGQWMKEVCDLDRAAPNFAWCFDCVPEENSLVLGFGAARVELPAIDLVFAEPRALLGEAVYARFGAEFPIRFDFLDTMGGGNLSLQVHPLTEYIRTQFGMAYTQDESYYMLDAGPDAAVYLGFKENVNPTEFLRELTAAPPFDADRHVARWPAKPHDHFLIPAGTIHCSGSNSMVLEISATPYIFTFKLWDWNRLGLDGKPRPLNRERGAANLQWDRTEQWVREQLINRVTPVAAGAGWREERTGLHESEFIETRRHWFTQPVRHQRTGSVEVLNLVAGPAAVVESPDRSFAPFEIHYAETFIVPAAAGPYTIAPLTPGTRCATLKAFVR